MQVLLRKGSPSTGMRSIALAIALASRTSGAAPPAVYGFGACPPCNKYYACEGWDHEETYGVASGLTTVPTPTLFAVFTDTGDVCTDWAPGLDGGDSSHAFGEEALVRRMWKLQGLITLVEEHCN